MNILFLTLLDFKSISERNIYTDLLRAFMEKGHSMCIISPTEKRANKSTILLDHEKCKILKLQIGNIQKTNLFKKGLSTIAVEPKFIFAIQRYFSNVKFDLVLYTTPPITLQKAVSYVKKRDSAKTYLLLKDIFPQNAVDLRMMRRNGLLHRFFSNKEKNLYAVSDYIGCMSPANVRYVSKNHPNVPKDKLKLCPNAVALSSARQDERGKAHLREVYSLPSNKTIFLYGGNLGKPQDVRFIIRCLKKCEKREDSHFVICGSGTDYPLIERYMRKESPANLTLLNELQRQDYDSLVRACDVGLIFLDSRFTIPNFPSRLLNYMEQSLPILACTDTATDLGEIITENGFGLWASSLEPAGFVECVEWFCDKGEERTLMGKTGRSYLEKHYSTEKVCQSIIDAVTN